MRSIGPFVGEALGVLVANRMRSFLTVLGLIIGVAAVIAIQILGTGMAGAVNGALGSLNDRSFYLYPKGQQSDFTRAELTVRDLAAVQATVPNIVLAFPAGYVSRMVSAGHARVRLGVSDDADISFASVPLVFGRNISHGDVASSAHVAVLTNRGYKRLYPGGGDPVGTSLRFGDHRYVVIGVQGPPNTGIIPVNFGGDVHIPYTTYEQDFLRARPMFGASFIVGDATQIDQTESAVKAYFKMLKANRAQYDTFDRRTFTSMINGIFAALTLVVALIGAISLLVAGIGIMNIMLVSVSERTREIGIRKAIGATRAAVLVQFFIEALLLSLAGCGIGLVLGVAVGWLVDRFALVALSGVVPTLPWGQSIGIAVGFATLVTVVFGTYPAYRAARLDPIEALRYE